MTCVYGIQHDAMVQVYSPFFVSKKRKEKKSLSRWLEEKIKKIKKSSKN
jgi:hypothetical protein